MAECAEKAKKTPPISAQPSADMSVTAKSNSLITLTTPMRTAREGATDGGAAQGPDPMPTLMLPPWVP